MPLHACAPVNRCLAVTLFLALAFALALAFGWRGCHRQAELTRPAVAVAGQAIAAQSDPAKLATLGRRKANPRLKRIVFYLAQARDAGANPAASGTRACYSPAPLNGCKPPFARPGPPNLNWPCLENTGDRWG